MRKMPSNPSKGPHKSSQPSSSHRKSRWEPNPQSDKADPKSPARPSGDHISPLAGSAPVPAGSDLASGRPPIHGGSPFRFPDAGPPQPPLYGFHNLERRTIVLADGSVRSYFALPPDEYPPTRPLQDHPIQGSRGIGPPLQFDAHHHPAARGGSPDALRRDEHADRGGGVRDYWSSLGLDARVPPDNSLKRKYEEDDRERGELVRQRHHLSQYVNSNSNGHPGPAADRRSDYTGGGPSSPIRRDADEPRSLKNIKAGGDGFGIGDAPSRPGFSTEEVAPKPHVDPQALNRSFLRYAKSLNESASQRKKYLDDGKNGSLQCIACGRDSKDYSDVHSLVIHAYTSSNADHLGLHKAMCVLMGWNGSKVPDNTKAYQSLAADVAAANREELIIWPPIVVIHNTNLGKRKDGRMDGMGNKDMDIKLRDLGFSGGKSKSLYGKEGHLGITVVKFANSSSGLKEAERLAEYFENDDHGRSGWAQVHASNPDGDDEKNALLVSVDEKTKEKKRILYGYLGTASDLDKVDFDTRKKAVIRSKKEPDLA